MDFDGHWTYVMASKEAPEDSRLRSLRINLNEVWPQLRAPQPRADVQAFYDMDNIAACGMFKQRVGAAIRGAFMQEHRAVDVPGGGSDEDGLARYDTQTEPPEILWMWLEGDHAGPLLHSVGRKVAHVRPQIEDKMASLNLKVSLVKAR